MVPTDLANLVIFISWNCSRLASNHSEDIFASVVAVLHTVALPIVEVLTRNTVDRLERRGNSRHQSTK